MTETDTVALQPPASWGTVGTVPRSSTPGRYATSRLNPYISFSDNARQAMEFYQWVFGGELT